jgi:hypothetical protein
MVQKVNKVLDKPYVSKWYVYQVAFTAEHYLKQSGYNSFGIAASTFTYKMYFRYGLKFMKFIFSVIFACVLEGYN